MPFTVSHVAAVLPAPLRRRLPFAALAVGAMSPDLESVLAGRSNRTIGHTAGGLFLLDLPLAFATLCIAAVAVPGLARLLPKRLVVLQTRLRAWRPLRADARHLGRVLVAILVGAASHLAIDSFTHLNGWTTQRVGVLQQEIDLFGLSLSISHWLQYGLSVLGMAALALSGLRWMWAERHAFTVRAAGPGPAPDDRGPVGRRLRPPSLSIEPSELVLPSLLLATVGLAWLDHIIAIRSPGLDRATAATVVLGGGRALVATVALAGMAGRLADAIDTRTPRLTKAQYKARYKAR